MPRKRRVKRLYKWETAQKERRALYRYLEEEDLDDVDRAFANGALFALEWMQGRRRWPISRYLVWIKQRLEPWNVRALLLSMDSWGYEP